MQNIFTRCAGQARIIWFENDVAIFNKQVKEKMQTEIEGESSNRSGGDQNDYLNDPAVSIPGSKQRKDQQP